MTGRTALAGVSFNFSWCLLTGKSASFAIRLRFDADSVTNNYPPFRTAPLPMFAANAPQLSLSRGFARGTCRVRRTTSRVCVPRAPTVANKSKATDDVDWTAKTKELTAERVLEQVRVGPAFPKSVGEPSYYI